MHNPPMVSNLDFARSLGDDVEKATPEGVADFLYDYSRTRGGLFNYNPASSTLYPLYRGDISAEQAIEYCKKNGNPKGRTENAAALEAVADFVSANRSRCHRISFSAVEIGRIARQSIYLTIKAPLARVAEGKVFIVMPGFRKTFTPTESQIDVACSFALATFARSGYEEADFEYLYAGRGRGVSRQFRRILGSERRLYLDDDLDRLLEIYVRGVEIAVSRGITFKRPNFRGFKIYDPRNPGLF